MELFKNSDLGAPCPEILVDLMSGGRCLVTGAILVAARVGSLALLPARVRGDTVPVPEGRQSPGPEKGLGNETQLEGGTGWCVGSRWEPWERGGGGSESRFRKAFVLRSTQGTAWCED